MSDDLLEATADSRIDKIRGKDYIFEYLSGYDRAELIRAMRKQKRELLEANLKAGGISGEQLFNELQVFDEQRHSEQEWVDFVNDPVNDYVITLTSLRYRYPDQAEQLAKRVPHSLDRRAEICGLDMVAKEPPPPPVDPLAAMGGIDPNATPGAVYGSPPEYLTSDTPKPESDTGSPAQAIRSS